MTCEKPNTMDSTTAYAANAPAESHGLRGAAKVTSSRHNARGQPPTKLTTSMDKPTAAWPAGQHA